MNLTPFISGSLGSEPDPVIGREVNLTPLFGVAESEPDPVISFIRQTPESSFVWVPAYWDTLMQPFSKATNVHKEVLRAFPIIWIRA
ncbi:hypothetical protein [Lysobacter humi (ex Lee et al. 2017)]